MKKIFLSLMFTFIMLSGSFCQAAEKYAYVELSSIMNNYLYAKNVSQNVKNKEAEIEKFLKSQNALIEKAKNQTEKKALEKKAADELNKKISALKAYNVAELKKIETNLTNAISVVAKKEGYTLVLSNKSVLFGASDITSKVLTELNKK